MSNGPTVRLLTVVLKPIQRALGLAASQTWFVAMVPLASRILGHGARSTNALRIPRRMLGVRLSVFATRGSRKIPLGKSAYPSRFLNRAISAPPERRPRIPSFLLQPRNSVPKLISQTAGPMPCRSPGPIAADGPKLESRRLGWVKLGPTITTSDCQPTLRLRPQWP